MVEDAVGVADEYVQMQFRRNNARTRREEFNRSLRGLLEWNGNGVLDHPHYGRSGLTFRLLESVFDRTCLEAWRLFFFNMQHYPDISLHIANRRRLSIRREMMVDTFLGARHEATYRHRSIMALRRLGSCCALCSQGTRYPLGLIPCWRVPTL